MIFIPSSFSWDSILGEKNFVNHQVYHHVDEDKKISNEYMSNLQLEEKNYELFLQLLVDLAKNNPKYNFVFRPHPRQSVNLIKKRFPHKIKNLHIIYKYSVTPWIIASKLYLHYGCTSSLEASYLRKKIIFFVENEKAYQARNINLYKSFGNFFNDFDKCFNFLNESLKNNLNNIQKSNFPQNLVYNSSRKNFSDQFIGHINKKNYSKIENVKLVDIKKNFNKNSKNIFNVMLSKIKEIILDNPYLSNPIKFFFPVLNLTKEYKKKKFDKITSYEIKQTIQHMQNKIGSKTQIKIIKIDESLFLLKKNTNKQI